jgi:polysaccharide biosynthesis/export protein
MFLPVGNAMITPIRLLSLILVCAPLASGALAGQAPIVAKAEKKFVAYRITRGDTVSVNVFGEPDLSGGGKRVEAVGTINLPHIGDVRLVGLTIKEAQESIEKAYREGRILRNPTVTVVIENYAPRVVRISGKINTTGPFEIPPDTEMTISELIFKANGFQETAKGTAVRVTRTMPDGSLKVFTLDVESAMKGKTKATPEGAAFVLEPDDLVFVPEKII